MCPGLTHKNVVDELAGNPVDTNTPVCILAEVCVCVLCVCVCVYSVCV